MGAEKSGLENMIKKEDGIEGMIQFFWEQDKR